MRSTRDTSRKNFVHTFLVSSTGSPTNYKLPVLLQANDKGSTALQGGSIQGMIRQVGYAIVVLGMAFATLSWEQHNRVLSSSPRLNDDFICGKKTICVKFCEERSGRLGSSYLYQTLLLISWACFLYWRILRLHYDTLCTDTVAFTMDKLLLSRAIDEHIAYFPNSRPFFSILALSSALKQTLLCYRIGECKHADETWARRVRVFSNAKTGGGGAFGGFQCVQRM